MNALNAGQLALRIGASNRGVYDLGEYQMGEV